MTPRIRAAPWIAAIAIACLGPLSDADACSVCLPGDPQFSAHGSSVQQQGNFSAFLKLRGWKKKSGALAHEHAEELAGHDEEHAEEAEADEHAEEGRETETNESMRLDLFLSWTPIDRLTLTVDLPWAFNHIEEHEELGSATFNLNGFGDLATSVSYMLWRNREVLPSTWVEGRAFVKFPTGQSDKEVKGVRDPHLQPGTGSYDFGFGLAAAHRLEWGSIYTSTFYRVNTKGELDYEYGDVVLTNVLLEVPVGHATGDSRLDPLTTGFGFNFRWAGKDRFRGQVFKDSGGPILYATPSLRLRLPWFGEMKPPSLNASVQIPLTSSWLHGFQKEYPIWSVGFLVPF